MYDSLQTFKSIGLFVMMMMMIIIIINVIITITVKYAKKNLLL